VRRALNLGSFIDALKISVKALSLDMSLCVIVFFQPLSDSMHSNDCNVFAPPHLQRLLQTRHFVSRASSRFRFFNDRFTLRRGKFGMLRPYGW
jgi:hypothetical protein